MNFFLNRYKSWGWQVDPENIDLKNCIRINTIKITEIDLLHRLKQKEAEATKIPFTKLGYWVDAPFSLGATLNSS